MIELTMVRKQTAVRRRSYLKMAGVTITGVGLAGCSGGDGGTDGGDGGTTTQSSVSLTVADWLPESHHIRQDYIVPWSDRIAQEASTDVTIDRRPAGQVGGAGEMLSLVRNNVAEVTNIGIPYFSGELALTQVTNLPGSFNDTAVAHTAFWTILQGILQEEDFDPLNIKAVGGTVEPPYNLGIAVDTKVTTLDDWQGLSVRSSGGIISNTIEKLGGTPTSIQAADVFSAFERGTVDANVATAPAFQTFDLPQFLNYFTKDISLGSFNTVMAVSQSTWSDLPTDVQEAMTIASEEIGPQAGATFDDQVETSLGEFEDQGIDVYTPPESDYSAWEDTYDDVEGTWANQLENRPVEETISNWKSALEDAR